MGKSFARLRTVAYHGPCFLRLTKSRFCGYATRKRRALDHTGNNFGFAAGQPQEIGPGPSPGLSSRPVSYQHWELLTRVATGPATEVTWLCRELVRRSDVERLFCIVRRGATLNVTAVDCDGYPLGYAEQRLRDSEFAELALAADGASSRGVSVTRKVSRASKRTAVIGALAIEPSWVVTLVLENRFSGAELATLDDQAVQQWVILVALAVRMEGLVREGAAEVVVANDVEPVVVRRGPVSDVEIESGARLSWDVARSSVSDVVPIEHAAERSETLKALDAEQWNISRAARVLGMTRHGLKKRMRRLAVVRPN